MPAEDDTGARGAWDKWSQGKGCGMSPRQVIDGPAAGTGAPRCEVGVFEALRTRCPSTGNHRLRFIHKA